MSKQNRKRKYKESSISIEYEIDAPKNKFRPFDEETQAEEEQLSKILFGGTSSFLKSLEEAEQEAGPSSTNVDSGVGEDDSSDSEDQERKPVWYDEDDDGIEVGHALDAQSRKLPSGGINDRSNKYSALLTKKFTSIVGTPNWATLNKRKSATDDDSDDEILRSCGFVAKTQKFSLAPNLLEFKKVKDLNCESYSEGPFINCVEFHPTSSAALVAGKSGIATLYAVDGRKNNKLHSIGFERFPILCGKFLSNGDEALLGSRFSHAYTYDLMSAKSYRFKLPTGLTRCKKFIISPDSKFVAIAGKWGEVHVLSAANKERVALLKQDSEVTALTYSPSGNLLYGHSDSDEITVWDMNMNRVKHKFLDEGCLQGTTLSVSSSNQFLAAGSAQGVVNLYGVEDVLRSKQPTPRKTIMNLTTSIGDLKFSPTSEVLAITSSDVESAVKLFHLESMSVFSNFPMFGSKFGNVNTVSFSPGGGFVAFGNTKSTVSLYRLKHYKNY